MTVKSTAVRHRKWGLKFGLGFIQREARTSRGSEPILVGVLFPAVFVKVFVEILFQLLVLFGHFDGERDFD